MFVFTSFDKQTERRISVLYTCSSIHLSAQKLFILPTFKSKITYLTIRIKLFDKEQKSTFINDPSFFLFSYACKILVSDNGYD